MLKSELLDTLTIEEWCKFKSFIANRPQSKVIVGEDVQYDDNDVHEFLTVLRPLTRGG